MKGLGGSGGGGGGRGGEGMLRIAILNFLLFVTDLSGNFLNWCNLSTFYGATSLDLSNG